jgi:NAD-dependent DNA ligase
MKKITKVLLNKLKANTLDVLKSLSEDEISYIIQQANSKYYNEEEPLFSDNIYDAIKDYLEELNPNNPILKNIGAVGTGPKKEKLPYFMGSLDKIKADTKAIDNYMINYPGDYLISDKLDGNSALLQYKNNTVKLYTRGDGTTGQNISHIISFIQGIPEIKDELTIRGELIISKKDFETVKDKGANARNMVSGLVNAKIPDLQLIKLVQFVAYEVLSPIIEPSKQMELLKKYKFISVFNKLLKNLSVETLSEILLDRRKKSDYEIDGIVVFNNKIHNRQNENPTYAFAFKSLLTMDKAEVIVLKVEWNLSKDAYLVPVIIFSGVKLDGVTISRATGFNGKFIKDNIIGPGSKIVIIRSGAVIPLVQEILAPSETGKPSMPDISYIWSKTGVDIMLSDKDKNDSDEVKFKNIDNFFNKIDVVGLSSGNIRKLYDSGFKTIKDILTASKEDMLKVDGFKDKMASKIYEGLRLKMKDLDCTTLIAASNTLGRGLGTTKIALLIEKIPDIIKKRYIPTITEIVSIKGFEKKTAELFIENMPKYWKFVDENNLSCFIKDDKTKSIEKSFENEVYVFTGFRNTDLEKYLKDRGANVTGSVSKKTTCLICKDVEEDSSKITKAKELGIEIITLSEFLKKNKIQL